MLRKVSITGKEVQEKTEIPVKSHRQKGEEKTRHLRWGNALENLDVRGASVESTDENVQNLGAGRLRHDLAAHI